MSFRVRASESVPVTVRRMARDRLDDAIEALESARRGDGLHENVHLARKRTKHVRALTRLVRGAAPDLHGEVNRLVRDAARLVSDLRDRQAVIETLDGLGEGEPLDGVTEAIGAVRPSLQDARDAAGDAATEDVERALGALLEVREGVQDWEVPDDVAALTGGFAKTYRRGRKRLADARRNPSTATLHEWRKRVKYHRYHVRMLEPVWPARLEVREDQLHRLTDLLGDDHDLAVLRGVLEADPVDGEAARTLTAVLDRRRAELQRAALPLGERLYAVPDDVMADQLAAWWTAWQEEAAMSTLPEALDLAPAS